jgi:hypothetical protein
VGAEICGLLRVTALFLYAVTSLLCNTLLFTVGQAGGRSGAV